MSIDRGRERQQSLGEVASASVEILRVEGLAYDAALNLYRGSLTEGEQRLPGGPDG